MEQEINTLVCNTLCFSFTLRHAMTPSPSFGMQIRKKLIMTLTNRFAEALVYANELHQEQARKSSGEPYIAHLLGVTSLALEHGANEDEAYDRSVRPHQIPQASRHISTGCGIIGTG